MKAVWQSTFVSIFALILAACTRGGDTARVSLSIPTNSLSRQMSQVSQSLPPPLQTLIANVQVPGAAPIVRQMDFDGTIPPATIDLTFTSVPNGVGLLVQVLAVYATSGGAMQLKYGDAAVTVSGDTSVTVDLSAAGGITKQSYLAGRIQLADGTFPNGTLVALFQPPGGKPKMVVDQDPIVGGWFNIFAVNGAGITFDYLWKEGNQIVFSGLNPDLSTSSCTLLSTSGSCPFWSSGAGERIKVSKPVTYSRSGDISNSTPQSSSQMEYVLGFFGQLSGSGKNVCYANDVWEAMPRLFADAAMTMPIDVNFKAGATASQINISSGGGLSSIMSMVYTGSAANCSTSDVAQGNALILNHTLLGNNDKNYGGFSPPWLMVQPFNQNNSQYVTVSRLPSFSTAGSGTNGTPNLTLTGMPFAPTVGTVITGSGILGGTTISAITGNPSTGTYNVTLSQNISGTPTGVTLSQPYTTIHWQLLPEIAYTTTAATLSAASTAVTLSAAPKPVAGMYVRDVTNPTAISPGVQITAVTPISDPSYNVTLSSAATASSGSDVLSLSYLSGIEVWVKVMSNGQVFSYHNDEDCTTLASQGFQLYDTVSPTVNNYKFAGLTGYPVGPGVNYQFALCASVGSGAAKTYLGRYIIGQPSNPGDNGAWPFGWASADSPNTKTISSAADPTSDLGISSVVVSGVSVNAATALTTLTTDSSSSLVAGDEVLLMIVSMTSANDCGGPNNIPGQYTFARVLDASSSQIVIPAGTWIDQLTLSTVLNASPVFGTSFCSVQAIRVPQFRNLTLNNGIAFAANTPVPSGLGIESVVPLRVNGTMSLAGVVNLKGTGFMGGTVSNTNGSGSRGPTGNTGAQAGSGGWGGTNGGGGAGYGNGGMGSSGGLGGQGSNWSSGGSILFVGGGGGSDGTTVGAMAGGAFFMAAYELQLQVTAQIFEDGALGPATTHAGGGGGGSVNILANTIDGPLTNLFISAAGGDGGSSGGGAGGGGYIGVRACSSLNAIVTAITTAGTGGSGAAVGQSEINYSGVLTSKPWCY